MENLLRFIFEDDIIEENVILKRLRGDSDTSDLSDSDSEQEEVYDDHVMYLAALSAENNRQSIRDYAENTVENYSEEEFGSQFKLNKSVYRYLVKKFEESEVIKTMNTRKLYSARVHITLFLWFATHESAVSFTDVADIFDLSKGTISYMIEQVSRFISNISAQIIYWPNEEKQLQTINIMEQKTGIRGIVGAMDITHIGIMPPKICKENYIDKKNVTSLCLQAICNEKGQFISFFTGFPGSVHDSRVFENSDIYSKLPQLCGNHFILADSAYKCSRYVITPYRDNGRLTNKQKNFNRKHSSGRVIIEHAFEMLKQRFRQLYYCKLKGIEVTCHFIRACCVLHNLCGDDYLDMDDIIESSNNEEIAETDYQEGTAKRDLICSNLSNQTV